LSSQAFTNHLMQLLRDADELDDAHALLSVAVPLPQHKLDALNRAVVVMSVSAWEKYVEELVGEAVLAMRPVAGHLGPWPVHYASVLGQAAQFHTPNPDHVKAILSNAVGLTDVHPAWNWPGSTSVQSVQALLRALNLRHKIAHGINPRPAVAHQYSSQLPDFFRRLGQTTDRAVRDHLVNALGVVNPWLP
jgi:hypothetical protein